jgi:thioredoxin-like negative regulator of GroEL
VKGRKRLYFNAIHKTKQQLGKNMIKYILSFAAIALAVNIIAASALAGEIKPYNEAAFAEAKAAGKTVLLDFHADWCPVCKKQGPVLGSLVQEDKLKDIAAFKVNYDDETALKKQLKVTSQSTLIVFKGEKLVSRAVGVTDKDKIRALIEKAL